MKVLCNILKLLIFLLIFICFSAFDFMICRFQPRFSGKEWIYLIGSLFLIIYLCEYIFQISFKEIIKKKYQEIVLTGCLFLMVVSCTFLYFNSEKFHSIFVKEDDECVATVWYYGNGIYENIYKFTISSDRKVVYEYSELQFEPIDFRTDIMERAKVEEDHLLTKQPEGYQFITKYKYNKLINNIKQLKETKVVIDRDDIRKKYESEFKAYISYGGKVFDISNVIDTDLKNNTVLSLFKCISFDSPNNLFGWYELQRFEVDQSKMAFYILIKYAMVIETVIIAMFLILKVVEKIKSRASN